MTTLITEQHVSQYSVTLGMTCENVQGVVSISKHSVQVLCVNAAHRAWRGGGRCFNSIAEALAHYKSAEMRQMIATAEQYAKDLQTVAA